MSELFDFNTVEELLNQAIEENNKQKDPRINCACNKKRQDPKEVFHSGSHWVLDFKKTEFIAHPEWAIINNRIITVREIKFKNNNLYIISEEFPDIEIEKDALRPEAKNKHNHNNEHRPEDRDNQPDERNNN